MDNKILERVKKLLAMAADGSSPNEAAIASKRARALMDKHQISQKDLVESDGFNEALVGKARQAVPKWEQSIAVAVAKYNDTICTFEYAGYGGKKLNFKGFDSDVIISKFMFGYLVENGIRLAKKENAKFKKARGYSDVTIGNTFKRNYGSALYGKLEKMTEDRQEEIAAGGTELMIVKKSLVEKKFGVARYGSGTRHYNTRWSDDHANAAAAGRKAGKRANINTAVGENSAPKKRLG